MKKLPHFRNAGIAALLILLLFVVQHYPVAAETLTAPLQQIDFTWTPPNGTISGVSGQLNIAFASVLRNNNTTDSDTFTITSTVPTGWPGVGVAPSSSVVINANSSQTFTFYVSIPAGTSVGSYTIDVLASRALLPAGNTALLRLTVNVVAPTATSTTTATPILTPTTTRTPGPICTDGFESDNNPASARAIDVNTIQEHTICPVGDEDWFRFGGVAGKVYTMDVTRQDPGIDLSLELFDPSLNSIAFNDDYYNRDPSRPDPGDTKPLITIRIPADGMYYIRVRDAAGRGGTDFYYNLLLRDDSYGPTPTMIRSICLDLFEPDGLPEQARLITSNEIQEEHRLCPTGDADWITFFAKAGKRYIIFTDTRRYAGASVNGQAQAGADTVMVLTDRDGVSLIDVNDDIAGGDTLDSQIEFTPEVDGFYFVQVKNVGDIGNQFIRYDMTLLLCMPGQTSCGRGAATTAQPVRPLTPQPTGTPIDGFKLPATNP